VAAVNNKPEPVVESKTPQPTKEQQHTDAEKKSRALKKKLKDMEALKERAEKGETLEKNQLAKLEKYDELKAELDKIMADG
jgi:uncharacterized protein with WD repeat